MSSSCVVCLFIILTQCFITVCVCVRVCVCVCVRVCGMHECVHVYMLSESIKCHVLKLTSQTLEVRILPIG